MKSSDIAKFVAITAAAGIAGAIGAASVGIASAQTGGATSTTAPAPGKPGGMRCGGRAPLDDGTAAKVKAAAEKAVEGATVKRSGHDRAGSGYLAMLLKADGTTRVLVHEDKDFKVTDIQDPAPARPMRGPGERHGRRGQSDQSATGTNTRI